MSVIDMIIEKLTILPIVRSKKESFEEVVFNVSCNALILPSKEELLLILNKVNLRDRLFINISSDGYPVANYAEGKNIDDFLNGIEASVDNSEDITYEVDLRILKKENKNNLSVYKLDLLAEYLDKLTFIGILSEFNKVEKYTQKFFRLQENNKDMEFYTKTYYFILENNMVTPNNYDRAEDILKRNQVCYFLNAATYSFTPGDFILIKKSNNIVLNNIMFRLSIIFALIYIANISNLVSNDEVKIIVNGYTTIEDVINFKDMDISNQSLSKYIDIQNWIYGEGSINDKIGIARNVLSLEVKNKGLLRISDGIAGSIQSAHEIYLKENVQQYLEVKNKISEFLFDITQKTSELANSLAKSFINNLIAIVTFYSSIIVMNSLSDKKLSNIFTRDITFISLSLITLSVVYMNFSRREAIKEKERFKIQYHRIRHSYDDVLNVEDLKNIFKNDAYYNEDLKYIDGRISRYTRIWVYTILIMLLLIATMGFNHLKNEYLYFLELILSL